MEPAGTLPRLAPTLPFKFVGGRVALDLLDTADWTADGPAQDRLASYERLLQWAEEVGVVSEASSGRLRKRAAAHPSEADMSLERCRELRRTLHRSVVALVSGRSLAPALDRLTPFVHEALAHLVLEADRGAPESAPDGRAWTTRSMALCGRWSGTRSSSSSRRNRRGSGSAADRTAAGSTSTGAGTGCAAGARWKLAERPRRTADGDDGRAGFATRARPGTSQGAEGRRVRGSEASGWGQLRVLPSLRTWSMSGS